ncbi:MAG: hypothetical protein V5A22_07250 [Salinivenus sp.]
MTPDEIRAELTDGDDVGVTEGPSDTDDSDGGGSSSDGNSSFGEELGAGQRTGGGSSGSSGGSDGGSSSSTGSQEFTAERNRDSSEVTREDINQATRARQQAAAQTGVDPADIEVDVAEDGQTARARPDEQIRETQQAQRQETPEDVAEELVEGGALENQTVIGGPGGDISSIGVGERGVIEGGPDVVTDGNPSSINVSGDASEVADAVDAQEAVDSASTINPSGSAEGADARAVDATPDQVTEQEVQEAFEAANDAPVDEEAVGDAINTVREASAGASQTVQEEAVAPVAGAVGEAGGAVGRSLDPEVSVAEAAVAEATDPSDQSDSPLESGARKFTEGVGTLASGAVGLPASVISAGETGVEAGQFTAERIEEEGVIEGSAQSGQAAAGATRQFAVDTANQIRNNPIRAAGSLAGSGGVFGAARRIGPRTSQVTRGVIQPGEELLGAGLNRVPRVGDRLAPNSEPIFFSEEAAIRTGRRAGGAVRDAGRSVADRLNTRELAADESARLDLILGRSEGDADSATDVGTADDPIVLEEDRDLSGAREAGRNEGFDQPDTPDPGTRRVTPQDPDTIRSPTGQQNIRRANPSGPRTGAQSRVFNRPDDDLSPVERQLRAQRDEAETRRQQAQQPETRVETEPELRAETGRRFETVTEQADQADAAALRDVAERPETRTAETVIPSADAGARGRVDIGARQGQETRVDLRQELDQRLDQRQELGREQEFGRELEQEQEFEQEQELEREQELEQEFEQEQELEREQELEQEFEFEQEQEQRRERLDEEEEQELFGIDDPATADPLAGERAVEFSFDPDTAGGADADPSVSEDFLPE